MLTRQQVALYRKDGYLLVPNVVAADQIAAARAALTRLVERSRRAMASDAERAAWHDIPGIAQALAGV
jgi:hypothetical protein